MHITNPEIQRGISSLKSKLETLNLDSLNIGVYNLSYLKTHMRHLEYSLYLNGCILQRATDNVKSTPVSFCDYGGGTGLLGFLAKESFDCSLIYADIYEEACRDVKQIAQALSIEIDNIVHGDIKTLMQSDISAPQFIISRDVIEHIYDLNAFFSDCYVWSSEMVHVHNTSANTYNIFRKKYFKNIHAKNEKLGVTGVELKDSETERPYFQLRKEIIQNECPNIDEERLQKLTILTRGMMDAEIRESAVRFMNSEKIEPKEKHPTNTCDPYTGNWAERLLTFDQYRKMAKPYHEVSFFGTYYNTISNGIWKKGLCVVLNVLIVLTGNNSFYLWPTMTITVKSKVK